MIAASRPLAGRRIIVAEDNPNGHRLLYVRYLTEYGLAGGAHVTLLVPPRVCASPQWALHLAHTESRVELREVESVARLRTLATGSRDASADLTVVPDGDFVAMRLGVAGRWRGRGGLAVLLMRDPDDEIATTRRRRVELLVKRRLFARARHVTGAHIVGLRSALMPAPTDRVTAPDPIELVAGDSDVARVRREWGLDETVFWFGVVGAITERKNLPLIVRALTEAAKQRDHAARSLGLIVAGRCEPGLLAAAEADVRALRDAGVSVTVVDRVLGSDEFDALVAAIDCVVAAHSNEGPSAVVARAGMRGKRVVAAGAVSLARDVAQLPGGRWAELDPPSIAEAMLAAVAATGPFEPIQAGTASFCEALLEPLLALDDHRGDRL